MVLVLEDTPSSTSTSTANAEYEYEKDREKADCGFDRLNASNFKKSLSGSLLVAVSV
jgi:hypothetical protein